MPAPLLNAGIVVVARAAPVGRPPLVAWTFTTIEEVVRVQPLQNSSTSSFVNGPEIVGVNVCPHHVVPAVANPFPELLESATEISICSPPVWPSFRSPGLIAISTFVPVPAEKSPNVVSVKHALGVAGVSERFWTVTAPSGTTTPFADAVL